MKKYSFPNINIDIYLKNEKKIEIIWSFSELTFCKFLHSKLTTQLF